MNIDFIWTIKREIERLNGVIQAARGAEKQIEILTGTVEMLRDVENELAAEELKAQTQAVPVVPRHEDSLTVTIEMPIKADTPEQPGTAREAPGDDQEVQPAARSEPEPPPRPSGAAAEAPRSVPVVLANATALEPLTQRQSDVFNGLWKLHNTGTSITVRSLTTELGFAPPDAVESLVKKGYAKRIPRSYPAAYEPIAVGKPRIVVPPPPPPPRVNGDASDPVPGRSALDKKRLIDELDPVGYLSGMGHACKRVTSDMYVLDRNTVSLKTILEQINIYRTRANLPSLDLARYL